MYFIYIFQNLVLYYEVNSRFVFFLVCRFSSQFRSFMKIRYAHLVGRQILLILHALLLIFHQELADKGIKM